MLNLSLKMKILQKFHSQADFALKLEINELALSWVVSGRNALCDLEWERWAAMLGCGVAEIIPKNKRTTNRNKE